MPWMGVGVPVGTGDEPFKGGSSLLLLGDCLEAVLGCSGSDSDGYSAGKKAHWSGGCSARNRYARSFKGA